jgi:CcmD family protein
MNRITALTGIIVLMFIPSLLSAQPIEMADTMRSEGKIYVVVAILLVIFGGLIGYLFFLDRKITRIEKKLPENKT